jgi:predicted enzyme related to lactoylglutathione lyase
MSSPATQHAIQILEAAFVGYPVQDINRARHFYESVLNLTPTMVGEGPDGGFWVEYDLKTITLAITNVEASWKPSNDGPTLALEVADINQTVQALSAAGVTIDLPPFETPVCWMAVIRDPEGNSLMIHQRKAPYSA